MAIYYRGAGVGTYWHTNDARLLGFSPQCPGMNTTADQLMKHVVHGTTASPYVSLTRSYGVAEAYASLGRVPATAANPAFVYEIELNDPLPVGLVLIDPVHEVMKKFNRPWRGLSYQHDGDQDFLLGVIDPNGHKTFLTNPSRVPSGSGATPRTPNLTIPLETMVRALRDAEILSVGTIPVGAISNRLHVF